MTVEALDLAVAQAVLATRKEAFDIFLRLLADHNRTMNLTRINSPEDIRNRHFLDSLAGLTVLDEAAAAQEGCFSMIDVGSGAGFPGLAIAIARPQWHIVSIEATAKKIRFQQLVRQSLGLVNVEIRQGRAETMAHDPDLRERFDATVARAVAGLDILAELTMAFVRSEGVGLFWKGPLVKEEIAAAEPAFKKMGARQSGLLAYRLPEVASLFYLATVEKYGLTPFDRPRQNYAAIKKRPLR